MFLATKNIRKQIPYQDLTRVITDSWFTPLTPNETEGEKVMMRVWEQYANHYNYFNCDWRNRLELFLYSPHGNSEYAGRCVATFIRSFGRALQSFLVEKLPKMNLGEEPIDTPGEKTNRGIILQEWALYDIRHPWLNHGRRYIEFIFRDEEITQLHHDIAENCLGWASSDEGRLVLACAFEEFGRHVPWLHDPQQKILGVDIHTRDQKKYLIRKEE